MLLLLQLYTGAAPNRRMMELIQFYLLGVASLEELLAGLGGNKPAPRHATKRKTGKTEGKTVSSGTG